MMFRQSITRHNPVWQWDAACDRLLDGSAAVDEPQAPPINVVANDDGHQLTVRLPGVAPQDVEVTVEGNNVKIRANPKFENAADGRRWLRRERRRGSFARSFRLPHRVDRDRVSATYTRGLLTIALPRAEQDKPKKIDVKAA